EGIVFAENLNPVEAVPDERGALTAMIFGREGREGGEGRGGGGGGGGGGGEGATGTGGGGTALGAPRAAASGEGEKEAPGHFKLDAKKKFFQPHAAVPNGDGRFHLSPDPNGFFTSYDAAGRFVSYYGDNHPRYAGNVVKAMASAKDGYRHVTALFA